MAIPKSTWAREFALGAEGKTVRSLKHPGRWLYCRYNARLAQSRIDAGNANKGAGMKMTNLVAARFAELVLDPKRHLSPNSALAIMRSDKTFEGRKLPCLRSFYNHIDHGDIGVMRGQTPYKPKAGRKKHSKAHIPKNRMGKTLLAERPEAADKRTETGHLEMDTIVSCVGGTGGLLTVTDRMSRRVASEKLRFLNQNCIVLALKRMKKRGVFDGVKSVTTDNGLEFPGQSRLEKEIGAEVFYTRAYASWEKGSIENANRLFRHWFPKGTDFACVTRGEVLECERSINKIPRTVLGGLSAEEFHLRKTSSVA